MGNRISIEQEEQDEAKFQRLVQDVVRARAQRPHTDDVEMGYGGNASVPDGHIQDLTAHRLYTPHDPRTTHISSGCKTLSRLESF